jgi:hypothetical protein
MNDRSATNAPDCSKTGLCARCTHLRRQSSRRGAVFLRCAKAEQDEAFLRYPPLPVRVCPGFETTQSTESLKNEG